MPEVGVIGATRAYRAAGRIASFAEHRFVSLALALVVSGVVLRLILICATTSPSIPANLLYPGYGDGARYVSFS